MKPFTCGFYIVDSEEYFDFWGDDCIDQFFAFIAANFPDEEFHIFVHNGGNFDFYFLTKYFDANMVPFIINGRLVKITAQGLTFRDSYSMIPVALGNAMKTEDGGKIEINYAKLEAAFKPGEPHIIQKDAKGLVIYDNYEAAREAECLDREYSPREFFKDETRTYQKRDCVALGTLVVEWLGMFGNRLTMASVALPMLRSFHGFETLSEGLDEAMRPYYFGGRCQAFETGVLIPREGRKFYGYDINSSYPDVMRRVMHPVSALPMYEPRITKRTHFARIRAFSNGALPVRAENGGLDFPVGTFDFFACIHEINAGLETGTLQIKKVYESIYFEREASFDTFIDHFYNLRLQASANKDEIRKLFYKLVMNSSYGKFAQDPRKYENWLFDPDEIPTPLFCEVCHNRAIKKLPKGPCAACEKGTHDAFGWYLHTEQHGKHVYARPHQVYSGRGFFNVACAASITSAARASLLRGIRSSIRPVYVDTDSIMCEHMEGDFSDTTLGAWKLEFEADRVCVAGKKLYAVFNGDECIKKASKGVRLDGEQIARICEGEVIEYSNPVPKFKLNGDVEFITRRIKKTGKEFTENEKLESRPFLL